MRGLRNAIVALAAALFTLTAAAQTGAAAAVPPPPAGGSAVSVREAASKLPASAFYGPADIESARLSPSGRWLALRTTAGGARTALAVFDVQEWKLLGVAARFGDIDIDDFYWVNDERLVFDVEDRQRGGGDQIWWPGLWSVKRDGTELRQLINPSGQFVVSERRVGREPLPYNHRLLHVPAGEGDEVVVGEVRWDSANEFKEMLPKRLDVRTGIARPLAEGAPDNAWAWMFDAAGEPRLAFTRKQGRVAYHWRAPGASAWKLLTEFDALKQPYDPLWIGQEGTVYVGVNAGDDSTRVLRRLDPASGQVARENLVSTPGFDFRGGAVAETQGARTLGIRATTDAETTVWFDSRLKALQAEADARWPALVNRLNCRRCDRADMTVLMFSYSDRDPGQYWVYRAATQDWRKLGDRRAAIAPRLMGMTDFVRISARDGLSLPVWITRPAGVSKGPLPAVVLVHGGPWVRGGNWAWRDDVQFLASRGYLVIEPEFRGSTGYGQRLHRAGFKQWGRAMQDDVADAVAWAVKQGHADASRVCIAGASYGGYATLMGLVRHPELYRCGVAWVAVTDPRLLMKWMSTSDMHTEFRQHTLPEMIGDPVADAQMLEAVTPASLADRIHAPLFLAFGGNDRRVPVVHGERMRDALKAAGRPPEEWVVYPGEGHGWFKLETRLDFARRLEAFLARHIGPDAKAPGR